MTVVGDHLSLVEGQLCLVAVRGGRNDPDGEQDDAQVHDHAAVGPTHQAAPQADMAGVGRPHGEDEGACRGGRRHGAEAEPDQRAEAAQAEDDAEHDGAHADPHRDRQTLPQHGAVDFAPAEHRRHRHEEEQGEADRNGHRVEERRAHIDLLLGRRLVEERIQRAEQHDEGEADEEHVVEQERPLAPEGGVDATRGAQTVTAPGDEPEAHDDDREEEPDEQAARCPTPRRRGRN